MTFYERAQSFVTVRPLNHVVVLPHLHGHASHVPDRHFLSLFQTAGMVKEVLTHLNPLASVLSYILRDVTGTFVLVSDRVKGDEAEPVRVVRHIQIAMRVPRHRLRGHIMQETMHMPRAVLVLFGDKQVLQVRTEFLVVVAYPDTEVTDEVIKREPILFIGIEGQRDEILPRVTESQFPNGRTRPCEVTEFLFLFRLRVCQKAPRTPPRGLKVGQLVD